jgi:hypothetical protein
VTAGRVYEWMWDYLTNGDPELPLLALTERP